MKPIALLSTIFLSLVSITISAQCPAPSNIGWESLSDSTYVITFESEVEGNYLMELDILQGFLSTTEITGEVIAGINVIELNLAADSIFPIWPIPNINNEDNFYAQCDLSVICSSSLTTPSAHFFLSNRSMIFNENIEYDQTIVTYTNPNPQVGFAEYHFTVDEQEGQIESMNFAIDIGPEDFALQSAYSIVLFHPNQQDSIVLTPQTGGYTSALYSDFASEEGFYGSNFTGVLLPFESFANFQGLAPGGEWTLRISSVSFLTNEFFVYGFAYNLNTPPCANSISGKAFFDYNDDGLQNDLEPGFSSALIENSISGDQFFTVGDGNFWNCSEAGDGTLTVMNVPEYYEAANVDISLADGDQLGGVLIPITASEIVSDVVVDLISLQPNRPGFEATYLARVNNVGTLCEDDVSLEITFPEYVEIVSSPNADLIITGNTASMDVTEICPFNPVEFNLTILLDDTVSLGTILEATISANISDEDPNELNNSFTSSVIVVGAYDPNDKQVSATTIGDEFLEDGAPLKYTIRFQNTGTFYAERVVIADTIDADLDINSLHIISTSHNMQLVREDNVLYFEFDQIFLPDSTTDFDGSIGHVRYEIDPLPTFNEGETIENTAYIYFDFNEPIVTNTVVTEFGNPLSVANELAFETRLFPNPADQNITISWAQDVEVDRIEIFDLSGRLVKSRNVSAARNFDVEVNDLTNGMYLLNIVSGELNSRQKFMKLDKL